MTKSSEVLDLVAGYGTWVDADGIALEAQSEAPAATTTFCAFTVSYALSRATVQDGC